MRIPSDEPAGVKIGDVGSGEKIAHGLDGPVAADVEPGRLIGGETGCGTDGRTSRRAVLGVWCVAIGGVGEGSWVEL